MTKPMIRIHDLETNEIIDREMTDDEFAAYEIDQASISQANDEALEKEELRTALLTKLGITAEEAALLLS